MQIQMQVNFHSTSGLHVFLFGFLFFLKTWAFSPLIVTIKNQFIIDRNPSSSVRKVIFLVLAVMRKHCIIYLTLNSLQSYQWGFQSFIVIYGELKSNSWSNYSLYKQIFRCHLMLTHDLPNSFNYDCILNSVRWRPGCFHFSHLSVFNNWEGNRTCAFHVFPVFSLTLSLIYSGRSWTRGLRIGAKVMRIWFSFDF